jgi:hypothetical protein
MRTVLDKRHSLEYRLDGALWRGIDKNFDRRRGVELDTRHKYAVALLSQRTQCHPVASG